MSPRCRSTESHDKTVVSSFNVVVFAILTQVKEFGSNFDSS